MQSYHCKQARTIYVCCRNISISVNTSQLESPMLQWIEAKHEKHLQTTQVLQVPYADQRPDLIISGRKER